ncbi:group II intron reverse transcriptase/maturase [bacterium CPR1]|nr:group II intron reverse transcriptase/maturase [bacterium CPR1]
MPTANHPIDKARQLQRTLYRVAKQCATRRFHALYDKVHRGDILRRAWENVKNNRGVAGVDGQTIRDVEKSGVDVFLSQLQAELQAGEYKPQSVKRVYIPKPDGRRRPLGIPAIRDRVVQAAMKIVVEPIFEADFQPCSFGFRPKRSAHDANEVIRRTANKGHNWVIDADIEDYFSTIDHEKLMTMVSRRISDRRVLKLIRQSLEAGVLEEGVVRTVSSGTPQGGVLSPVLANVYLNYLDKVWAAKFSRYGTLVRYADDLVVLCRNEADARRSLQCLKAVMERLGLRLHPIKTRIVDLRRGSEGFEFLGFHHRKVLSWRYHKHYLQRWPRAHAMAALREKIRDAVGPRSLLSRSLEDIIAKLNPILRGWGNYFAVGNSAKHFSAADSFVRERLCLFLSKKHRKSGRGWATRWRHIDFRAKGLHHLTGTVRRYTLRMPTDEEHRKAV